MLRRKKATTKKAYTLHKMSTKLAHKKKKKTVVQGLGGLLSP